jgi:hypothetical protein
LQTSLNKTPNKRGKKRNEMKEPKSKQARKIKSKVDTKGKGTNYVPKLAPKTCKKKRDEKVKQIMFQSSHQKHITRKWMRNLKEK